MVKEKLKIGERKEWLPCRSLQEEIAECPSNDWIRFVFHGTPKKEVAERILREGFQSDSFFASEFDNAFFFGNYILRVATCLPEEHRWQWTEAPAPCPDRIHQIIKVNPKVLYEDDGVRKAVYEENVKRHPKVEPLGENAPQ